VSVAEIVRKITIMWWVRGDERFSTPCSRVTPVMSVMINNTSRLYIRNHLGRWCTRKGKKGKRRGRKTWCVGPELTLFQFDPSIFPRKRKIPLSILTSLASFSSASFFVAPLALPPLICPWDRGGLIMLNNLTAVKP
jgi:hypothetical protein